jgi:hypothetical protein
MADKKIWHLDAVSKYLSTKKFGTQFRSLKRLESFRFANAHQLDYISKEIISITGYPVFRYGNDSYDDLVDFLRCSLELQLIKRKFNDLQFPVFGLYLLNRWRTVKDHLNASNIDRDIKLLTAHYFLVSEGFDEVNQYDSLESIYAAIVLYAQKDAEFNGIENY